MTMRLMIRGYLGRTMQFERRMDIADKDLEITVGKLAEQHAAEMAIGTLGMVELEFLDEPDVNERFYRFGVDPRGMVIPIRIL